MKLRIRGNSVRLRITKTEIEQFDETGVIEGRVEFGPGQGELRYAVEAGSNGDARARFDGDRLTVSVPTADAKRWVGSDLVGLEYLQPIGDGKDLRILVEKDFACLAERPGEDDSDAFSNPLAAAKC